MVVGSVIFAASRKQTGANQKHWTEKHVCMVNSNIVTRRGSGHGRVSIKNTAAAQSTKLTTLQNTGDSTGHCCHGALAPQLLVLPLASELALWCLFICLNNCFSVCLSVKQIACKVSFYSVIALSFGIFSPQNAERTSHESPVRASYWVVFVYSWSDQILSFLLLNMFNVLYFTYSTTINWEPTVFTSVKQVFHILVM